MAELRLAPQAEAELDDIWLYIARESDSIEIANRVVESITDLFLAVGPLSKNRAGAG